MAHNTCLGIPIDHRLRKFIGIPKGDTNRRHGDHIERFSNFADWWRDEKGYSKISIEEREFGRFLASPETQGGLVLILERPSDVQSYSDDLEETIKACPSLQAIDEIFSCISKDRDSIKDISVFDFYPLMAAQLNQPLNRNLAQDTFLGMIREKKPKVTLCCSSRSTAKVAQFASLGVGKSFRVPETIFEGSFKTYRINAFHPSYAVNRNPTYSVFRDLLLLEFAHAYGILADKWTEEPWMGDLRKKALQQTNSSQGKRCLFKKEIDQIRRPIEHLLHGTKRIAELSRILKETECFALTPKGATIDYDYIVKIDLRSVLCDISLVIKNFSEMPEDKKEPTFEEAIEMELLEFLHQTFSCFFKTEQKKQRFAASTPGLFILESPAVRQKDNSLPHQIWKTFHAFYQQLNDTFTASKNGKFKWDLSLQGRCFLDLSIELEDALAEWIPKLLPNSVGVSGVPKPLAWPVKLASCRPKVEAS